MIYRIDIAVELTRLGGVLDQAARLGRHRASSVRSPSWCCCATTACCSATRTSPGFAGVVLLILPIIPGLGTDANADVWVSLGFFSFQPGELAKIALAIFFAGYLVRTRESLTSVGTRFLGLTWPRARELGPLLVIWLDLARHHRAAARPRHRPAHLRHVRGDALRRDRQDELGAHRRHARRRGRVPRLAGAPVRRRAASRTGWMPSTPRSSSAAAAATSSSRASSGSRRAGSSAPGSDRGGRTSRRCRRATTSSRASARSSA